MENVDRGHEYRLNTVRSVHTTKIESLSYRPTELG